MADFKSGGFEWLSTFPPQIIPKPLQLTEMSRFWMSGRLGFKKRISNWFFPGVGVECAKSMAIRCRLTTEFNVKTA